MMAKNEHTLPDKQCTVLDAVWRIAFASTMITVLSIGLAGLKLCAVETTTSTPSLKSFPTPTQGERGRRIALFTTMEYTLPGDNEATVKHYRLFIPSDVKESEAKNVLDEKSYPLLVWLHGYGESGDDNWRHLAYIKDEVARWEQQPDGFPAFVLALQSSYKGHWDNDVQNLLMQLIERAITNWPIDSERVYLAGVSSGGSTCWRLGAEHADVFAAIAPMASSEVSHKLASLNRIPIWAFQVTDDPVASPEQIRNLVAAIQANGGSCWLTETAGRTHDCWTAAFVDYDVVDWLLTQRLNHPATPVPSLAPWKSFRSRYLVWDQLWPVFTVLGGIIFLVWVFRRQLCMQRKHMGIGSQKRRISSSCESSGD
jgi:predicted peptidase